MSKADTGISLSSVDTEKKQVEEETKQTKKEEKDSEGEKSLLKKIGVLIGFILLAILVGVNFLLLLWEIPSNLRFGFLLWLLMLGVLCLFYVLPTIVAVTAGRRQVLAIAALNLLLGWTFLGWVLALIWSLMKDDE